MSDHVAVHIVREPPSLAVAMGAVSDPGHGAIDLFIGVVRDNHDGKDVSGMTYDVHEPLAATILATICQEAAGTWPDTHFYAAHYQGSLSVGGISVLVAVSAPHRADCFAACRYVIEEIKTRLPVWKQEHYLDGHSAWLPGHSLRGEAELSETCCGLCAQQTDG